MARDEIKTAAQVSRPVTSTAPTPTLPAVGAANLPAGTTPPPSSSKLAADLLAHLRATGAPVTTCLKLQEWLRTNEGASAEALYRHMEETGITLGTVRRSGKWVWGDDFEPETAADKVPAEEVKQLRIQVARLTEELETSKAHLAASRRRVRFLEEEKEKQRSELLGYRRRDDNEQPLGITTIKPS